MKNLKAVLLNCGLVVLGVLTLGFLAGTYMGISGYDFLEFLNVLGLMGAEAIIFTLSILFTVITVSLLIVCAIVSCLISLEVIKSEKACKILTTIELVLACLIAVFAIIPFVIALVEGAPLGWALILNLVIALGILAVAIVKKVCGKKAQ